MTIFTEKYFSDEDTSISFNILHWKYTILIMQLYYYSMIRIYGHLIA